jgi:hypothetical protein
LALFETGPFFHPADFFMPFCDQHNHGFGELGLMARKIFSK